MTGTDVRVGSYRQLLNQQTLSNGCKLIGDIEIGNDIVIAAGAVVTKSFTEPNSVVGGVPGKVISHSGNPFPSSMRGADVAKKVIKEI